MTTRFLTLKDIENMPDPDPASITNLDELRIFLKEFPDDLPCIGVSLSDIEFTVLVDSHGNAQRVPSPKSKRLFVFYLEV